MGTTASASDVCQLAEVFVVLVVAALPLVDRLRTFNELDGLYPLDHLEAKLVFDPQPQRRTVQAVQRLEVHLVGQEGLRVQGVLYRERVVELTAFSPFAKGIEDHRLHTRL